jgi:hypothetical protein
MKEEMRDHQNPYYQRTKRGQWYVEFGEHAGERCKAGKVSQHKFLACGLEVHLDYRGANTCVNSNP